MATRHRGMLRLLFRAGEFDNLPAEAKRGGPWTGTFFGDWEKLKPEYRLAIARDGYVRIEGVPHGFSAEA
jgi:hypothetical protein